MGIIKKSKMGLGLVNSPFPGRYLSDPSPRYFYALSQGGFWVIPKITIDNLSKSFREE